jgi:N-acetylmuramic acid 6-phosphate etherase
LKISGARDNRPMARLVNRRSRRFLGIEGGATHSVALLADDTGKLLQQATGGPANLQFLSDAQLVRHLRSLTAGFPRPDGIAIGLAGAWADSARKRIVSVAAKVWPDIPCYATHDLETALVAAEGRNSERTLPQVLIVSGTGSACYGKTRQGQEIKIGGWGHLLGDHGSGYDIGLRAQGQEIKIGGWGHLLGDHGSGYDIGLRALRSVIDYYDSHQRWPRLGQLILRALQLNEPVALIPWVQAATKAEIAALTLDVFRANEQGDRMARQILFAAAQSLAVAAATCARRIVRRGERVHFALAGSVLLRQPVFRNHVRREIRRLWPNAVVAALPRKSAWGAVELARRTYEPGANHLSVSSLLSPGESKDNESPSPAAKVDQRDSVQSALVRSRRLSPTEQRHPRSMNLDQLPLRQAIELVLSEDARVPRHLLTLAPTIERVITAIVRAFRSRGRLFYVGAGTSGRLGVLDASECPPTFRTPPDLVQGIIAGGYTALWQSVEGAEDDSGAGALALKSRAVNRRDVVVGIAASGTTPFVWGALDEAKRRHATTVLLCFNPYLVIPAELRPTIVLAPDLGPELLTGSTRLKAGTATKLLLNLFTTLAMVRLGKVRSNLMIDLHPANVKLRDRATRIVQALTETDYARAREALAANGWWIKKAIAYLRRKSAFRASRTGLAGTRR